MKVTTTMADILERSVMMKPGKMLLIDLVKETSQEEEIPPKIMADCVGGRGLGAYLLFKSTPAKVDPLGPDNPLIFSVGPAEKTNAFYSSRAVINCKSPLTKSVIGPAGEMTLPYAAIITGGDQPRSFGRGDSSGAVARRCLCSPWLG
jgi:aldehyde:ferredoxin oxidoreductase